MPRYDEHHERQPLRRIEQCTTPQEEDELMEVFRDDLEREARERDFPHSTRR